jgi:hypothetical protein
VLKGALEIIRTMYISRLPSLLNHVHAIVAFPVGMLEGTVNEYVKGSGEVAVPHPESKLPEVFLAGNPPSMECITLKTERFVSCRSYVIET